MRNMASRRSLLDRIYRISVRELDSGCSIERELSTDIGSNLLGESVMMTMNKKIFLFLSSGLYLNLLQIKFVRQNQKLCNDDIR